MSSEELKEFLYFLRFRTSELVKQGGGVVFELEDTDPILSYIEERYGKYQENPHVHVVPSLYEECGSCALTLMSNNKPACIRIDRRLLRDEFSFTEAFVHELFEWRFLERGEKYPHASAVKATHEFLSHFNIRPKAYPLINSLFPNVGDLLERFLDLKERVAKRIFGT